MTSKRSFLNNLMSSFGAQLLTVALNFISIPFLILRLGVDGYGLIAFYSSLQAVFAILDAGFSPLVIRETASSSNNSKIVDRDYSALLDTVKSFFFISGILGCAIIFVSSEVIVKYWINLNELDISQLIQVVQIMGFIICLRWWSGFYRSLFIGHQNILIFNYITIFVGILKFLVVILYLDYVDSSILGFFKYQLICSVIELLLLYWIGSKINNYHYYKTSFSEKINAIKTKYRFAIHAGVSSLLWLILTQSDKFLVLKIVSLENFGIYSLGVLGASLFFFISSPLSSVLIPRLIQIKNTNGYEAFKNFYLLTFNICTITLISIAFFIFKFSEELLFLWTSNTNISEKGSFILGLYALGNSLAVLSSFAYFLQSAIGNLRLHFLGSLIFVSLFLPLLGFLVIKFNMNGAPIAWLVCNIFMFIFWGTYIHSIYMRNFYLKWLFKVFGPVALISALLVHLEYMVYLLIYPYAPFVLFSIISCIFNLILLYILFFGFNLKSINLLR